MHLLRTQCLTLSLEGITAADYLSWVRDPEPLALGRDLRCVAAHAEPLGDRIELELVWDREPPAPRSAAVAAGFALVPEVVEVATGHATTDKHGDRGRIHSKRAHRRNYEPEESAAWLVSRR